MLNVKMNTLSPPRQAFSPPSVTASLSDDQLLVTVQFPCAANRRCSLGGCCPISEMIDPWTTVTVYNKLNQSEYQVRHALMLVLNYVYMRNNNLHT